MNTPMDQSTRISGFCRGYFQEEGDICVVFEKCAQKELYKQEYPKERGRGALSRSKRICIVRNPAKLPGFLHTFNPFVYLTIDAIQDIAPAPIQTEEEKGKKSRKNKKQKTQDDRDDDDDDNMRDADSIEEASDVDVPPLEDSASGDAGLETLLEEDGQKKKVESAPNPHKRKRVVDDEDVEEDADAEMSEIAEEREKQRTSRVYEKRCTQHLEEYFFCGIVGYANMCEATWTKITNVIATGYFLQPIVYTALKTPGDAQCEAADFLESPYRVNRTNAGMVLTEQEKEMRGIAMDFHKPALKADANRNPSFMSDFAAPVKKNAVIPQEKKQAELPFPSMFSATTIENYSSALKTIIDVSPALKIKDLDQDAAYFYSVKPGYWKKLAEIACCGLIEPTDSIKKMRHMSRYSKIGTSCICDIMKVVYPYSELFWGEVRATEKEGAEEMFGLLVKYEPTSKYLRDTGHCQMLGSMIAEIEKTRTTCDIRKALIEPSALCYYNICSAMQLFSVMGRPRFDLFLGEYIWTCVTDNFVSSGLASNRSVVCADVSPYSMACQYGVKLPPKAWLPLFMKTSRSPFCAAAGIDRNTKEHEIFMEFFDVFMKSKHGPTDVLSGVEFFDYTNIMKNILTTHILHGRKCIENEWFDDVLPSAYFLSEPTKISDFFVFWKKDLHSALEMFCNNDQLEEFVEHVKKTNDIPKFFVSCTTRLKALCYCLRILRVVGKIPHSLFDTIHPDYVAEFIDASNPKSILESKDLSEFESKGSNSMLIVCSKIKNAIRLSKFFASNPRVKNKNLHVISFEGINADGRRSSSKKSGTIENILSRAKISRSNSELSNTLKHELYKILTGYNSISMETFTKNNQRGKLVGVDVVFSDVQDVSLDVMCNNIYNTMFDSDGKEIAFWVDKITFCCNSLLTTENNRLGFHTPKLLRQWFHFQQQRPETSGAIQQLSSEATLLVTDQHVDATIESLNMILDEELSKGIDKPRVEPDNTDIQSDYDRVITSSFVMDCIKNTITRKAKLIQGEGELSEFYARGDQPKPILLSTQPFSRFYQGPPPHPINEIKLTNHFYVTQEDLNSDTYLIDATEWTTYAGYYDWITLASLVASPKRTLTVVDKSSSFGAFGFKTDLERAITKSKKCITPNIVDYLCNILYQRE